MGRIFLENGGLETVTSYGLKVPRGVGVTVDQVQQVMPARHLSFFLNLESFLVYPRFIFAHAGLNPERDIASQVGEDLYWIRDPFINNVHRFEKTVVFGHTPYENVLFHLPYKIGIDTGLVYGNMLTAVELVQGHIFQVRRHSQRVEVSTFPAD
jgi:serine/threonine protein phosphatase 1